MNSLWYLKHGIYSSFKILNIRLGITVATISIIIYGKQCKFQNLLFFTFYLHIISNLMKDCKNEINAKNTHIIFV